MKAIFKTKFANDMEHNGEQVEILDYKESEKIWNSRYKIKFIDGTIKNVYGNEIEFID